VADPDPIAAAEADITGALAELREARTNHEHSPNTDSEYWVEQAQRRLDVVMDRRKRLRAAEDTADQLVRR
jgi:hypothetical protein